MRWVVVAIGMIVVVWIFVHITSPLIDRIVWALKEAGR